MVRTSGVWAAAAAARAAKVAISFIPSPPARYATTPPRDALSPRIREIIRPSMPCRYGAAPDHRVSVELVEADIEIGFCLVDLVESCPSDASRLVANAEEVYEDVVTRLTRLE